MGDTAKSYKQALLAWWIQVVATHRTFGLFFTIMQETLATKWKHL